MVFPAIAAMGQTKRPALPRADKRAGRDLEPQVGLVPRLGIFAAIDAADAMPVGGAIAQAVPAMVSAALTVPLLARRKGCGPLKFLLAGWLEKFRASAPCALVNLRESSPPRTASPVVRVLAGM